MYLCAAFDSPLFPRIPESAMNVVVKAVPTYPTSPPRSSIIIAVRTRGGMKLSPNI